MADRGGLMIDTSKFLDNLNQGLYEDLFLDIYVDPEHAAKQKERYSKAVNKFIDLFGAGEMKIYSAPGRSEIGGNHTDHQHGEILAAAINNDAIGIVRPLAENKVRVLAEGYDMVEINLDDLSMKESEKVSTLALIKGVLAGVKEHGYKIGGFEAYTTSDVLIGAGLSSSAAYETLIGTILSGLYNDLAIPAIEIAIIGQYAENVYFGKPCGLMDQMASSVGSLVHVDFADPKDPVVEKVDFDMNHYGYSLCITDTKGSHADLTDDYAAIPQEMKKVAAFFGQEVLISVNEEELLAHINEVREAAGDRGVLRALHFLWENPRVQKEVKALQDADIDTFLATVAESGKSSFQYLQNVYTNADVQHQNVSIALALSEKFLGDNGVCRVHGGGFAGTIQAFVKHEAVAEYRRKMDAVFGEGACSVLQIRKYGGKEVI